MKTSSWLRTALSLGVYASSVWLLASQSTDTTGPEEAPSIQNIQIKSDEVVVTVWVPQGIQKVTLETKRRLSTGAWVPRKVARLDGEGGEIVFRIPVSPEAEMIRVRADESETLPASFYSGDSEFAGPVSDFAPAPEQVTSPGAAEDAFRDDDQGGNSDVVESDIYYLNGSTLYFFNQYRGLQVIDLTDSSDPVVLDTYEIPAAGEDMYMVDASHVALLARDGCGWGVNGPTSQLILLNVDQGVITPVSQISVQGSIVESRLVGSSLFVAAQTYLQTPAPAADGEVTWVWGVQTQSFDLSDVSDPALVDTTWTEGYGNVVYATRDYFFVGVQGRNWRDSTTIHFWDISAGDGSMVQKEPLRSAGRVADKFKMNFNPDNQVFTMISEARANSSTGDTLRAVLETIDLRNPDRPVALGEVEVGHGESLFATRFDGDKAYIVTFLRVDPLWVVDLSDPANPTVSGELEVPGWSNYIHPMGDRLLTVGIDNVDGFRVAISLFDVADPQNPGLLSKVSLGDNHSWSEANYDEKAFTVLEDQGLALVPFQGDLNGQYSSQVQLIDLDGDELTARGVIPHEMTPRRAVALDSEILSISGRELLVVDVENRDQPEIVSTTELSWSVNQVVTYQDYLILAQDTNYSAWNQREPGKLRVVSQSNPDILLGSIELEKALPVVGLTRQDDTLYVAQTESYDVWWWWGPIEGDANGVDKEEVFEGLVVTAMDLSNAPEITVLDTVEIDIESLGWNPRLKAHWMNDTTLAWSGGGDFGYFLDAGMPVADVAFGRPFWGGYQGNRFIALDVAQPDSLVFASETRLADNNGWWGASEALHANELLYLSHQSSEYIPGEEDEIIVDEEGNEIINKSFGYWVQKHYMTVIDFSDPYNPTLREEVDLPGALRGLSHSGEVLYTVGYHYDELGRSDWTERLDALAYDGVEAALISSMKLPNRWPHPVSVSDPGIVTVGIPGENDQPDLLQTFRLDAQGDWKRLDQLTFDLPISQLKSLPGDILLGQIQNSVVVVDFSDPANLVLSERTEPDGCLWFDLTSAAGSADEGIWIPLQDYGIFGVQLERDAE